MLSAAAFPAYSPSPVLSRITAVFTTCAVVPFTTATGRTVVNASAVASMKPVASIAPVIATPDAST